MVGGEQCLLIFRLIQYAKHYIILLLTHTRIDANVIIKEKRKKIKRQGSRATSTCLHTKVFRDKQMQTGAMDPKET